MCQPLHLTTSQTHQAISKFSSAFQNVRSAVRGYSSAQVGVTRPPRRDGLNSDREWTAPGTSRA